MSSAKWRPSFLGLNVLNSIALYFLLMFFVYGYDEQIYDWKFFISYIMVLI